MTECVMSARLELRVEAAVRPAGGGRSGGGCDEEAEEDDREKSGTDGITVEVREKGRGAGDDVVASDAAEADAKGGVLWRAGQALSLSAGGGEWERSAEGCEEEERLMALPLRLLGRPGEPVAEAFHRRLRHALHCLCSTTPSPWRCGSTGCHSKLCERPAPSRFFPTRNLPPTWSGSTQYHWLNGLDIEGKRRARTEGEKQGEWTSVFSRVDWGEW